MKVSTYKLLIKTDRPIITPAVSLRGFIGDKFSNTVLLHNHLSNRRYLYTLPRVQYHVNKGNALIVGIEEAVETVKCLEMILTELILDGKVYKIISKMGIESQVYFGILDHQISYSFLTPWLALNEKNYEQYQKFGTWSERKELLENILIGNILSMSKSLGYTVPQPIKAEIGKMREVKTRLKDVPMLGFLGTFSVNFEIPDYWGIGKSVSRGFGTLIKCNSL